MGLHRSPYGSRNDAVQNTHGMESPNPTEKPKQWNFFIAHVSEDKDEIARPLAEHLNSRGLMAWYPRTLASVGGPSCNQHRQGTRLRRPKDVEGSGIEFPLAPHRLANEPHSC
jgi:hypothetical protein